MLRVIGSLTREKVFVELDYDKCFMLEPANEEVRRKPAPTMYGASAADPEPYGCAAPLVEIGGYSTRLD